MRRFALNTNQVHLGAVLETPAGLVFAPARWLLLAAAAFLAGVLTRLVADTHAAIGLIVRFVVTNVEFHLMIFGLGMQTLLQPFTDGEG
jgi:putative exporter of polyketide antibiotics